MSIAAKDNCYAVMWSYGVICVGCGCCKRGAYKERIRYHEALIEEANKRLANITASMAYDNKKIKQLKMKLARKEGKE